MLFNCISDALRNIREEFMALNEKFAQRYQFADNHFPFNGFLGAKITCKVTS
jgi:hypothetical protein